MDNASYLGFASIVGDDSSSPRPIGLPYVRPPNKQPINTTIMPMLPSSPSAFEKGKYLL